VANALVVEFKIKEDDEGLLCYSDEAGSNRFAQSLIVSLLLE